ncbi:MAG: RluA family pseudouridine synthase [Chitinophagaceae bacterium]|nr:MAG: RluA family pseudouridine synthase [Chitinophagaceae bacterium]
MADEINNPAEDQEASDELYERFVFNTDKGQEPYRIDKFLMNRIESATRNKLQRAINAGLVLVNGKEVKQNYKVKALDQIIVYSDLSPESTDVVPENIPLNIIQNDKAMRHLAKQFYDHTVKRQYLALVWGDMLDEKGTIVAHVGRNLRFRKLFEAYPEGDHGKEAITHYQVVERFNYVTLVQCVLETGRTHQIRVHMKHIGHPLFNDDFYGGDKIVKGTIFSKYKQFVDNCFAICPRQALHARTLGFVHPSTGKEIFFESPLPDDIANVIEKWRNYATAKNL